MSEEKDDFLREIEELLGDSDEDHTPPGTALANGSTGGKGDIDLELTDTLKGLSTQDNHHQATPKTGIEALKEAISAHQDIEVIRSLFEGGKVPDEVRADLWKECLTVSKRPDTMGSWSGPLDCENQEVIHRQCLEQADKLASTLGESRSKEDLAQDMELVITFYCKSRNLRYLPDCGWPELLLPFLSLSMSRADLFNCFYTMMAKYIPRDCKMDGKPFYLFRLLLLYHDPELCSFLDTKKLSPDRYLQPWLRSLFVSPCEAGVIKVMWDHYLMEKDPFFFFFLALVMVVNAKEVLMQDSSASSDDLCSTISSLPCQLSAEDIDDFFSLALYYAARTPQSFRKDYHSLLFGSGRGITSLGSNISHALCLPISLHEVMEMNQRDYIPSESGAMHYSIVDCRPVVHFSCGHLPDSHNLDANLLLHSPADFAVAAERLCSRLKQKKEGVEGSEHICFLGSGREQEDQYVTMVVAKFLQKSTPYVSLARGGFLELSSLLNNKMGSILEDYDPTRCHELYSDDSGYALSTKSDASDSDSEGYTRYRQKLQSKGARLYAQMASGFSRRSQHFKTKFGGFLTTPKKPAQERHVSQLDKPSKRYRGVHADVFVIADEDDNENPNASGSDDEARQEMVNISMYSGGPGITHTFPATEIYESREYQSHILLSADSIVVLRELSDRAGWGRVKYKRSFEDILKITAKKKNPDIITFRFGTGTGEDAVVTEQLRFRIPNTTKATAAIKNQILKYQEACES